MIRQPLFVLATPNGHSARIAAMLGQHPEAFFVPELNLVLADHVGELLQLFRMAEASGLEDGLLRTVAELFLHEGQTEAGIKDAWRWLERRVEWPTADLLCEIARSVAPRQLVVPETHAPLRADLMERLESQFPDAHWLHLTRHPRPFGHISVEHYQSRVFVPPDYLDHHDKLVEPLLDPQLAWYRLHMTIDRSSAARVAGPGSVMSARAESILSAPESELSRLARWMGWSEEESALAAMMQPQRSAFAMPGPPGAREGMDYDFMVQPEFVRTIRPLVSLDGPLQWLPSGQGFAPEVKALARSYGYG